MHGWLDFMGKGDISVKVARELYPFASALTLSSHKHHRTPLHKYKMRPSTHPHRIKIHRQETRTAITDRWSHAYN